MEKRILILNTALELFVNQGFHDTPTSLIAKKAGVATGTLFHYFKTKEELINTLYRETKEKFFAITTQNVEKQESLKVKVRLLWFNTIEWALACPREFLFIQQFTNSPFITKLTMDEVSEHFKFYYDLIDTGKEKNLVRDIPTDLLYQLSSFQIFGIINYLYNNPQLQKDKDFLEMSFDLYWDTLKKN
jgi:AcrR family transcriptional regulator